MLNFDELDKNLLLNMAKTKSACLLTCGIKEDCLIQEKSVLIRVLLNEKNYLETILKN